MTPSEYKEAQERLDEIESEAEGYYDILDELQKEREELEAAIEQHEAEQAALDE